ncbi:hypothetical protein [Rhodoferax antarcticus]|nr:hypothetical protein [Rhodoferax antarcticus]
MSSPSFLSRHGPHGLHWCHWLMLFALAWAGLTAQPFEAKTASGQNSFVQGFTRLVSLSNAQENVSAPPVGANGGTLDISSTSLGNFLGKGGNKNVYAYGDGQAVAVLQPGKPLQAIPDEIGMLNQLNDLGIPTVNARSITVNGQPAMIMDQFAQGSKDIVALQNGKVRIVGDSPLLNAQSVSDLQNIRNTMVTNNVQINDLQFLIGKDGRVVVADPLKVNINTPPSNNNLRMIDLLIQAAKKNGPF